MQIILENTVPSINVEAAQAAREDLEDGIRSIVEQSQFFTASRIHDAGLWDTANAC